MNTTLKNISLLHFKNYEQVQLTCSPGINCLVGKNGMGKTNFLDAIYYLCMTKSHFSTPDASIIQHGADFFRMEAQFELGRIEQGFVVKYQARKKKVFENNQVPYDKLAEHIGRLPVVMIAPDDSLLATDGSEIRRKFIDNTLSQIDQDYLSQLMLYNKLLKQRNALLKKMAEENRYQKELLLVYDQQMAPAADFIFQKRSNFAEVLLPVFQVMHDYICRKEEAVQLSYKSQLQEKDIEGLFKDAREKDRILQRTTTGIHKDDLIFQIEGRPLKRFASQGQLKSYILALKLSQFEILRQYKEQIPILLLDDIFDKLDQHRVKQLLELLHQPNFGQVFITDTNPNRVARIIDKLDVEQRQFLVEDSKVSELPLF